MTFTDALQNQVIVLDGAMGTQVQNLPGLDLGGEQYEMLTDLLVFAQPDALRDIHLTYYRAGANALETNTFGATPFRLGEYDFSELDVTQFAPLPYGIDPRTATHEKLAHYLSKRGAEIACDAREAHRKDAGYDGRPLFVVGSVGPSNRVLSSTDADLKVSTFGAIAENFRCQVAGLIAGGVDAVLFETQQDILETKAGVFGAQCAMADAKRRVPIMVQVTVDAFSKMQIFNTDIHAAQVTVDGIGVDTFGINCSIGPDLMAKTIEKMARYSPLPISVVPNAGLPVSEDGQTVYRFAPDKFAGLLRDYVVEYGVNIVGGCCGTTPEHIAATAEAVRGIEPKKRSPLRVTFLSGPQEAVPLDSSENLIMVGERLNVRGSKKVRRAVEGGASTIDREALEDVVNEQVEGLGLTILDVCMDSNVVDTNETLRAVVHSQTTNFAGAMSLDSFSVEALAEAVKVYPGRPLINSMSMEEVAPDKPKVDEVIEACDWHHPAYVGLAAGDEGPAATREGKAELARQIVERAGGLGVGPERIFIDMNIFPIGSESEEGMNFAVESIEAIPLIKSIHPDLRTICGIGNLTNGLAKKPYMRKVLTSVWLDEARKKGLDAAIINPHHFVSVDNLDPKDYELGLRVVLERDMEAYEELEIIAEEKTGQAVARRSSYDDLGLEEAICQKIVDGFKQREAGEFELEGHTYQYADTIALQARDVVAIHEPLDFVNRHLMQAMNRLGEGFARGEVSLPHLLKSADVMKQVMGFLEAYMRNQTGGDVHAEVEYKGTIVVGTVHQDVHSIGKDLAKTLFENYGYRVIDLGVMTPLQAYIDAAKEHGADAIGMSALLVQTSNHMIAVARMMEEQGLADVPVLIGGAPVNARHAAYVAMAGQDDPDRIRDNVFYCATAMDGVNIMNNWVTTSDRGEILETNRTKLLTNLKRAEKRHSEEERLLVELPRREVHHDHHEYYVTPWFAAETESYSLREFAPYLDTRTLFALNWKFGGTAGRTKAGETPEKLTRLFEEWIQRADKHGWLQPQAVYGVYPCQSDGDEVIVYDLNDHSREV
ncbi:MAG: dihydropteroate synthase, partial [bacterium]|nr:dihydropteroate synthase [bacterium]